jgi:hypothetical protein
MAKKKVLRSGSWAIGCCGSFRRWKAGEVNPWIATMVPAAMLALAAVVLWWLLNKPAVADFPDRVGRRAQEGQLVQPEGSGRDLDGGGDCRRGDGDPDRGDRRGLLSSS